MYFVLNKKVRLSKWYSLGHAYIYNDFRWTQIACKSFIRNKKEHILIEENFRLKMYLLGFPFWKEIYRYYKTGFRFQSFEIFF